MANASWGMLQQLWNEGIGALFGTNILTIGGFFLIFTIFVSQRLGLNSEVASLFGLAMVFILTVMNPGLLPQVMWTLALILLAWMVYFAFTSLFKGF